MSLQASPSATTRQVAPSFLKTKEYLIKSIRLKLQVSRYYRKVFLENDGVVTDPEVVQLFKEFPNLHKLQCS
jgi:hypothetical protein